MNPIKGHSTKMQPKLVNNEVAFLSFLQLFEQYRGMLYAIALRMLGQGEDAKDAVQETFIKAYTHLNTLQNNAAFAGWLKSIIYNHCLMELRYRRKRMISLSKYAKEVEVFEEADRGFEKAPERIKNTISRLSESLQLTCMLRYFSRNSSYNEIATILTVPVGTIRSRLAEIRTKLASQITLQDNSEKSNKAKEMEEFFKFHFQGVYDSAAVRTAILEHYDKHVSISFSSGMTLIGSKHIKRQVEFDLKYGARATVTDVHSSGNVSVLELSNINPDDKPNLCPLSSTFIFVHPKNKTEKAFLHHASMPAMVE